MPDRYPSASPASIAAVGFALTAYAIGVDRGYVTREQARERVLTTVRFFQTAPQGPQPRGVIGYKGFFYHFLDMKTGLRAPKSELSTVDTALLIGGMLHVQAYFDGDHPDEAAIRDAVDQVYWRIDWKWAQVRGQLISMGWSPEKGNSSRTTGTGVQRGDAGGAAGARLADPSGRRERVERLDRKLPRRLGPLHGLRAPELRAPLRPPVFACVDRLPRHPAMRPCASATSTTSRTRGVPSTHSVRMRSRTRTAGSSTAPTSGASRPATVPGTDARTRSLRPLSATSSITRRAARVGCTRSTTARSHPPPRSRRCPSRPEIVIPAVEEMYERYGFSTSTQTYGYVDSFNRSFTAIDVRLADGHVDPELRLDRERLPRHRPGSDPRDDLQLPATSWCGTTCAIACPCAAGCSAPASTGGWLAESAG